jgi:hypothetical protein
MKNQLNILFVCLCLIVGNATAQKLDINWGNSFDSATDVKKIVGSYKNTMVALTSKGKGNFIETYNIDKGFTLASSASYEVPKIDGNESGLLNIALRDGKIFALVYGFNKKTKSFSIYAQYLTLEGKQQGKLTEVYASSAADEKIKDRIVDVRFSPDQSKALIFFDRTNADRTIFYSDVVVVDLNDAEAEPTVEKEEFVMRSGKSESVIFKMYHSIDNDGQHFYMTEKIELAKKVISEFTLSIKGMDINGKEIGNTVIKDDERVLLSPTIVSDKNHFVVVGYYMNNPKKRATVSGYAGLFVAKLANDLSVESLKTTKFSDKFFMDLYSDKKIERMNSKGTEILVPAPYTMDNIILHSDGTMTVLSEYYLVTVTDNGKGGRTTMTQYGNIIYYKINPDGDLLASDVIKKMQASSTTSIGLGITTGVSMFVSYETKDNKKKYWSYALATKDNEVFLVFNDNVKNMNDDEDDMSKALVNPNKSIPYLVTISEDGTFKKKAMSDSQDTDTFCVPQITYPLSEDKFIIWGVRKKENKFGVAEIK